MGKITIISQQKSNIPPTVNAGADIAINLPATGVSLIATAGDSDGYITSVQWSKLSGGSATINSPNTLTTTLSGLILGTYDFQIIVYDNFGASAVDVVRVVVNTYQLYVPLWLPDSIQCEVNGAGANTGKVQYNILMKVSNDINQYPLDVNNQRTVDTGLAQQTKPNTVGNPDYVQPYVDTVTCPIVKRFHSISVGGNPERSMMSSGSGFPITVPYAGAWGLDNNTVLENTIPGITFTNLIGDQIQVLKVAIAGSYNIKLRATGSITAYVDNGRDFTVHIDFFMRINGVEYPLSPVLGPPSGYTNTYMYEITVPGGSQSHKEGTVAFNLTLDQVLTLPLNALVEWYVAPRFSTSPLNGPGVFRYNNSSIELDIKL